MGVVVSELKSGVGLGSAFAFLAARIKDYGAITAAVQLYEKALETDPTDPSIALNYIHTLELHSRTDEIIAFMKKFLLTARLNLLTNLECKDVHAPQTYQLIVLIIDRKTLGGLAIDRTRWAGRVAGHRTVEESSQEGSRGRNCGKGRCPDFIFPLMGRACVRLNFPRVSWTWWHLCLQLSRSFSSEAHWNALFKLLTWSSCAALRLPRSFTL